MLRGTELLCHTISRGTTCRPRLDGKGRLRRGCGLLFEKQYLVY